MNLIIPITIDGNRLYELTVKGKKETRASWHGRGGLEHRYFTEKVKQAYEAIDGTVWLEKEDIDLVIELDEKRIAIEIETGKSDIKKNLQKLNTFLADDKYIVATNKETQIRINQIIKSLPSHQKIISLFVKDFIQNI